MNFAFDNIGVDNEVIFFINHHFNLFKILIATHNLESAFSMMDRIGREGNDYHRKNIVFA